GIGYHEKHETHEIVQHEQTFVYFVFFVVTPPELSAWSQAETSSASSAIVKSASCWRSGIFSGHSSFITEVMKIVVIPSSLAPCSSFDPPSPTKTAWEASMPNCPR